MANGLQIAASGLIAQEYRLDAVANDIANVNTVGYQQSRAAFSRGARHERRRPLRRRSARLRGRARSPRATTRSRSRIDGPGFIQVRTADGTVALTRDGDLQIDGDRNLVTSSGATVDPPIAVPADVDASDISFAPDGTVTAAGRKLGQLTLVDVPAPGRARGRADGLLTTTAASGAAAPSSEREGPAGRARAVERRPRHRPHRHDGRAAQLPAREPALHTQDQLLEIANGIRR